MRSACRNLVQLRVAGMAILAAALTARAPGAIGQATRPAQSQPAAEKEAWWQGRVEVPGQPLDFVVVFRRVDDGESYRATIDIPAQRVRVTRAATPDSLPPLTGLKRPLPDYSAPAGAPFTAAEVRIPAGQGADTFSLGCTLTTQGLALTWGRLRGP